MSCRRSGRFDSPLGCSINEEFRHRNGASREVRFNIDAPSPRDSGRRTPNHRASSSQSRATALDILGRDVPRYQVGFSETGRLTLLPHRLKFGRPFNAADRVKTFDFQNSGLAGGGRRGHLSGELSETVDSGLTARLTTPDATRVVDRQCPYRRLVPSCSAPVPAIGHVGCRTPKRR